jgi:hypothetical protein
MSKKNIQLSDLPNSVQSAATSNGSAGSPLLRRTSAPYVRGQLVALRVSPNHGPGNTVSGGLTERQPFKCGPAAVSDISLCFANWQMPLANNAGEVQSPGAAGTIKVSLEYNGNYYPVWFGTGTREVTLDPEGEIWSLPVGIEIPANATFYVRTLYIPASGTTFASNYLDASYGGLSGACYVAADEVDGTGSFGSGAGGFGLFAPVCITGVPAARVPQVAIIGDSRAAGNEDGGGGVTTSGGGGYLNRAIAATCVSVNLGLFGENGSQFLTAHGSRGKFIAGCDYALEAYGVNDINGGAALATVQATRISIWKLLTQRGLTVFADTLQPKTTSTDSWVTTVNQTHALTSGEETNRVSMNQWIRAGAPLASASSLTPVTPGTSGAITAGRAGHPLAGTFDSCALVETAVYQYGGGTDSGIWQAPGGAAITSDGIHCNPAGAVIAATAVPVSLLA